MRERDEKEDGDEASGHIYTDFRHDLRGRPRGLLVEGLLLLLLRVCNESSASCGGSSWRCPQCDAAARRQRSCRTRETLIRGHPARLPERGIGSSRQWQQVTLPRPPAG